MTLLKNANDCLTLVLIKALTVWILTLYQGAPSITFHALWQSTLVVTIKHYGHKGQGTSGNANTAINNRLPLSSCQ